MKSLDKVKDHVNKNSYLQRDRRMEIFWRYQSLSEGLSLLARQLKLAYVYQVPSSVDR